MGSNTLSFANGDKYYYQGTTAYLDNGAGSQYTMADLTKGDDGIYRAPNGNKMYIALDYAVAWTGDDTLKDYVDNYPSYFNTANWPTLVAGIDENGLVPLTDANYALFVPVISTDNWGEDESNVPGYLVEENAYAPNYSFENVGIKATGEYQITVFFSKSLAGFNLFYNLSGNWLVYEPYYEAGKSQVGDTDAWVNTYNSSVENTMSYGPYKMTSFTLDHDMTFEKNENWFGYTDGKHVYVDPEDGKEYDMYQTTKIFCQKVANPETRKAMFLAGQLMTYGLQSEDFETYRGSDYCHVTPGETIFFFIFNGYLEKINEREANEGFDTTQYDLQTITLKTFRQAVAVSYDKEALCTAVMPSRSGGYGLIGNLYIYDPDTGSTYRGTPQAKQVLCDFYSIDVQNDFGGDLDRAVASITGYDPVKAKELYTQAYTEALAAGYITDANNDGICDQTIEMEYSVSTDSTFVTKVITYLNNKMAEITNGTPFEGKIVFKKSAPYGDDWSTNIRNGMADTVLGGWGGSALDPFSLSELYTDPSRQYDAKWFDSTKVTMTMTVNTAGIEATPVMEEVTLTLQQWSKALNGTEVTVAGKTYNFGDGIADIETRMSILAKIEGMVLQTYDYIPMIQDAGMALLSQQVYYVVEDYNVILGRGGITYLKYNYNDTEWAAYVASQNGTLTY